MGEIENGGMHEVLAVTTKERDKFELLLGFCNHS